MNKAVWENAHALSPFSLSMRERPWTLPISDKAKFCIQWLVMIRQSMSLEQSVHSFSFAYSQVLTSSTRKHLLHRCLQVIHVNLRWHGFGLNWTKKIQNQSVQICVVSSRGVVTHICLSPSIYSSSAVESFVHASLSFFVKETSHASEASMHDQQRCPVRFNRLSKAYLQLTIASHEASFIVSIDRWPSSPTSIALTSVLQSRKCIDADPFIQRFDQ